MKLNEIVLLELRDLLPDRILGAYGAWIMPSGKIYTVQKAQGHASFLAQHLDLLGLTPDIFQSENPDDLNFHKKAFEQGLVRVAHPKSNSINFQGMPAGLKNIAGVITRIAAQTDVHDVYIDKMENPTDEGIGGDHFDVTSAANLKPLKQYLEIG